MTTPNDAADNCGSSRCYAAMPMVRLRYLAGMMCMVEARHEHARRMRMESEHKVMESEHKVMEVTWNDDGTMTLVIEGHVEPVKAGDLVVYRKANHSETPNG